jgi:hypothetical protein
MPEYADVMTIKTDSKRIRANIAQTRAAVTNARNRAIPKFKHPERPKRGAPEPTAEATVEEPVAKTEPDAG